MSAAEENRWSGASHPDAVGAKRSPRAAASGPLTVEEVLALPAAVPLETAGRALGLGRTKTNELARADQFPIPILTLGRRSRRCTRAAICEALGLSATP